MHPSLVGPRLKWRWANDHIASLGNKIRAFFDGDSYSVGSNFDQETEQHVIAVRLSAEPPLARWSLMVGDALHNLRSALDYLIYQLAIKGSGQEPPPYHRRLQFPVFIEEHGDKGYDA